MEYLYETHMHTSEGSACGRASGAEMARDYKALGYTGIFVTDHFFNGNTAVDRSLPWAEKVELFCKGYEAAKEEGDRIGLDVFFGFEYGVHAADFLVYNLGKDWLLANPDVDQWKPRTAFCKMRRDGGFIVHAHPFRERDYIERIQLFPRDVDGVEIYNGGQGAEENERGRIYAQMYDLPVTSGSDCHKVTEKANILGIVTQKKIETPADYLAMMRAGQIRLLSGQ